MKKPINNPATSPLRIAKYTPICSFPRTLTTIKYETIAIIIDEKYTPLLNAPNNTF